MIRTVYTLFVSLMFIILQACSGNLETKVMVYEQAHNMHYTERVMSLYSDDITFEIVGAWKKTGKEEVKGVAEWDAATNSHMIISDIVAKGDKATFKLKEGNDWFRNIGIEFMYYDCIMVFKNGLINELKAETSEESIIAFQEAWPPLYKWLLQEKGSELLLLMNDGEFIYNSENAKMWLIILKEYQEISSVK